MPKKSIICRRSFPLPLPDTRQQNFGDHRGYFFDHVQRKPAIRVAIAASKQWVGCRLWAVLAGEHRLVSYECWGRSNGDKAGRRLKAYSVWRQARRSLYTEARFLLASAKAQTPDRNLRTVKVMRLATICSLVLIPAKFVSADQLATGSYVKYLSRSDMTDNQNLLLAECMVALLSPEARAELQSSKSKRAAELAFLADGKNTSQGVCIVRALTEAK